MNMFESVVEKVLQVYLSHYVEGIKGNLHLAVWSGNVFLENLEIKRDIAERLSLPFKVIFGKIGRLVLEIPWSGLGSQPVKIVFESLHVLLAPREADKSDDDLLSEIRQAKEYAVSLVENEFKPMPRYSENQMANSSYMFRLVAKILNNIQVHIKDIHINYADKLFSIGFKLKSLSVHKCHDDRYIYNQDGESYPITHSCELLEASIYCTHFSPKREDVQHESTVFYGERSAIKAQDFDLNSIEAKLSQHECVLSPLSMRLHTHINSWDKTVIMTLEIGNFSVIDNKPGGESYNDKLNSGWADADTPTSGINVVLTQSSLASLIKIANSVKMESIRKSNLLLAQAHLVACDAESLKTVTKNEFIRLYTLSLSGAEMTEDERERLQSIFDATPIRHLAKWRIGCKKSVESLDELKPGGEPGGSGLWNWVKGKTQIFTRSSRGDYEFGGVTLDCEQMQLLQEAMQSDDLVQDTPAMGSFNLSFTLGQFSISIIGRDPSSDEFSDKCYATSNSDGLGADFAVFSAGGPGRSGMSPASPPAHPGSIPANSIHARSLTLTLANLHSNLFVQSAVDCNEMDTYNIHAKLGLSRFQCQFEGETMVQIDECGKFTDRPMVLPWHFASLSHPFADPESSASGDSDAIYFELVHNAAKNANMLYLGGIVSPVELFVIPQKVANLMAFASYFARASQEAHLGNLGRMRGMRSVESLEIAADDESSITPAPSLALPELFAFDINISAPIVHLVGANCRTLGVDVHFGKLIAKTNGACSLDNIAGIVELRETKMVCTRDGESIHLLKPIPVKIHFSLSLKSMKVALDIIFEELFVQISPVSITAVLDVPISIYKILAAQKAAPREACNGGAGGDGGGYNKSSILTVAQEMARRIARADSQAMGSSAPSISCSLLVRHSGFALYNSESTADQVLLVELNNALVKFERDPDAPNGPSLYIGLEGASVRNPLSNTLLFLTGQIRRHPASDAAELDIAKLNLCTPDPGNPQTTVRTGIESLDSDEDFFEDALEENYKSMEIDVTMGDTTHVDARLTDIEAYWQYESIRIAYEEVQKYSQIVRSKIKNLPAADNLHSQITNLPQVDLPPNPNGTNTPDTQNHNTHKDTPCADFDGLVKEGIDNETIPHLALLDRGKEKNFGRHSGEPTVEIKLSCNEAAISFLQDDNSQFGRLAAQKIKCNVISSNCEALARLDIENGVLLLDSRCLLKAVAPEEAKILSVEMRFYAGNAQSAKQLPFSLCMLIKMSRINYIYYQNDLSRLMDYLNDGILNVFISKSYQKVVTAASKRHTLFKFSIDDSSIIMPRDQEVLRRRVADRLSLPVHSFSTAYLLFYVDKLTIKNCYTACANFSGGAGSGAGLDAPRFTLLISISRLSLKLAKPSQARVQFKVQADEPPATGTEATGRGGGCELLELLEPVDTQITYQGGPVLNVCLLANRWHMKLNRENVTMILDVINENVLGNSYLRRNEAAQAQPANAPSLFRMNVCFYFRGLDINLENLASIVLDQLTICLNYFSDERAGVSDNGYQFGFCSQTLIIDDLRDSKNVHRRLLTCVPSKRLPSGYPQNFQASPEYFLGPYMSEYARSTGQDFFNPANTFAGDTSGASAGFAENSGIHGTKLVIVSNNLTNSVDWLLNNSTISMLSVMIGELASFFYQCWSECTMCKEPSGLANDTGETTGKGKTGKRGKLLEISCHVNNGKFVIFTDVTSPCRPKIECLTNFAVSLTVDNKMYRVSRFDIERCKIDRVAQLGDNSVSTCLCDYFNIFIKGNYCATAENCRVDFAVVVPRFNINLYSKDLGILAAAVAAINTDAVTTTKKSAPKPKAPWRGKKKLFFKFHGVSCTFLDDTRASIVPILRLSFAADSIALGRENPSGGLGAELLSCSCNSCSLKLEYLNAQVGEWEPFIEQVKFELMYQSSDALIDTPLRGEAAVGSSDVGRTSPAKFKSYLYVTSLMPIWINVTPHLCQLLLWLEPLLRGAPVAPAASSPSHGGERATFWGKSHTHYAYFCLNLSGQCYYASNTINNDTANYYTSKETGKQETGKKTGEKCKHNGQILALHPNGECFPIDIVANRGYKTSENDEKQNIYLIPAPPFSLIDTVLSEIFQGASGAHEYEAYAEPVMRDLMVTRSVAKTVDNFRHRPQGSGVYDPCPPYFGPFPAGVCATVVPLLRNGSVPVNAPLVDAVSLSHNQPNEYSLQTPNFKHACSLYLKTNLHTVDGTTAFGQLDGNHNDNLLCHVLTPHVSHKILLICSTVRVFNRSGLPLYLQFLDKKNRPCNLPKSISITAPISVLDQMGAPSDNSYFDAIHLPFLSDSIPAGENVMQPEAEPAGEDFKILLKNGHFASVPYWVFWGPAHVNLRFTPAINMCASGSSSWSRVIDTHVHQGSRWRQCICNGHKLYFLANIKSGRSAFPGEKEIRDVTIMPAMTILNALPVGLDVKFSGHDGVSVAATANDAPLSPQSTAEPPNLSFIRQQTDKLQKTDRLQTVSLAEQAEVKRGGATSVTLSLKTRTLMHLYALTPNESLHLQLKISSTNAAWTKPVPTISRSTVVTVEMKFDGANHKGARHTDARAAENAPIEVELVRYPVAQVEKFISLVVTAPLWMVDKTGLGIKAVHDRLFYPRVDGVTFLRPSKFNEVELALSATPGSQSARSVKCQIPVAGGFGLVKIPCASPASSGGASPKSQAFPLCLNTHKILFPKFHAYLQSRVISIAPEFMVTNNIKYDILIREDAHSSAIRVPAGKSVSVPWGAVKKTIDKEELELAALEFTTCAPGAGAAKSGGVGWSSPIYVAEQFAGVTYLGLQQDGATKPTVYSLKAIPILGMKHLCIGTPSAMNEGFILTNKSPHVKCVTLRTFHSANATNSNTQHDLGDAHDALSFSAKYKESIHIGWSHPFVYSSKLCQIFLWLDRKTVAPKHPLVLNLSSAAFRFRQMEVTLPERGPIIITAQRMGNFISITVHNQGDNATPANPANCQITLTVPQIGLSLISHLCRQELVYAELSNLTSVLTLKGEHQILELRLTDIQVDMQLEGIKNNVILANKGSTSQKERRFFLQLYVDRSFSSLNDLYLRKVFIAVDDLQLDIGAQICESLADFYYECIQSLGVPERVRNCLEEQNALQKLAFSNKATLLDVGHWVSQERERPQSSIELLFTQPLSISLDYLYIQNCTIFIWCCFELSKLYMLGDLLRMGLRIISASNNLELKGAPVQFPQEFASNVRATATSFYEQFKDKYIHSAISCLGTLLGYSSLVNIPRMPITLGRNTIEFAAEAVDNVTAGLGNILSAFTFDTEYIKKMQKERTGKSASNIREGFASAGKSIGEGVLSLTNILTKPIEGAQKSGVGGFFKGIGIGIAGSIVKPIDQVRQAVSHVSRGIKADMAKPVGGYKWRCQVRRKPRMLWGEFGKLCDYNAEDAELKQNLGAELSKNIMKSLVTATSRVGQKTLVTMLLFYPSQLFHVSLIKTDNKTTPNVIWKIDYAGIINTRASNYGVHVETKTRAFQIPAATADMIYSAYKQVEEARSQATCFATI